MPAPRRWEHEPTSDQLFVRTVGKRAVVATLPSSLSLTSLEGETSLSIHDQTRRDILGEPVETRAMRDEAELASVLTPVLSLTTPLPGAVEGVEFEVL
ncbi:MAG: hypothetical protein J07HR59_01152 [Halorubrum sp. J07HR59]|nr:MAG: hypothetical protein J07HR59_01152 [Halorubrum sp. J07HR59]